MRASADPARLRIRACNNGRIFFLGRAFAVTRAVTIAHFCAIFRAEYARPADGLTRQAVISFGSIARRESRGCELDASCETVDSLRYTSKG